MTLDVSTGEAIQNGVSMEAVCPPMAPTMRSVSRAEADDAAAQHRVPRQVRQLARSTCPAPLPARALRIEALSDFPKTRRCRRSRAVIVLFVRHDRPANCRDRCCFPVTALRTAAASGMATRLLARDMSFAGAARHWGAGRVSPAGDAVPCGPSRASSSGAARTRRPRHSRRHIAASAISSPSRRAANGGRAGGHRLHRDQQPDACPRRPMPEPDAPQPGRRLHSGHAGSRHGSDPAGALLRQVREFALREASQFIRLRRTSSAPATSPAKSGKSWRARSRAAPWPDEITAYKSLGMLRRTLRRLRMRTSKWRTGSSPECPGWRTSGASW